MCVINWAGTKKIIALSRTFYPVPSEFEIAGLDCIHFHISSYLLSHNTSNYIKICYISLLGNLLTLTPYFSQYLLFWGCKKKYLFLLLLKR